jgi:REP element-mobilizing transposase RayT
MVCMSTRRPPRLDPAAYVGRGRYHLTIRAFPSSRPFAQEAILDQVRSQLLQTAAAEGLAVLAYCFMPNHLHVLVESARDGSDVRHFVKAFKQQTGYAFKRETGGRLWQEGYFDRILRREEDTRGVVAYIWGNPVRAGLQADFRSWRGNGSGVFRIEDWGAEEIGVGGRGGSTGGGAPA